MTLPSEHFEIAQTRFEWANRAFEDDEFHLAAHLFINAAIKYADFLCQKYLNTVFSRKHHSDTSFLHQLSPFLRNDYSSFKEAYSFLMNQKNLADYGTQLSEAQTKQIQRRAAKIKQITELHQ